MLSTYVEINVFGNQKFHRKVGKILTRKSSSKSTRLPAHDGASEPPPIVVMPKPAYSPPLHPAMEYLRELLSKRVVIFVRSPELEAEILSYKPVAADESATLARKVHERKP